MREGKNAEERRTRRLHEGRRGREGRQDTAPGKPFKMLSNFLRIFRRQFWLCSGGGKVTSISRTLNLLHPFEWRVGDTRES